MNILQKISLVLTIIGAINWGLIGLFNFNLVDSLFGVDSFLSMLIYILVGIAGIINIMLLFTDLDTKEKSSNLLFNYEWSHFSIFFIYSNSIFNHF